MRLHIPPRNYEAHSWFAWHPVWVHESRVWVWLEPVIRRLDSVGIYYYRLPSTVGSSPDV